VSDNAISLFGIAAIIQLIWIVRPLYQIADDLRWLRRQIETALDRRS
jgi:hypothetical protein